LGRVDRSAGCRGATKAVAGIVAYRRVVSLGPRGRIGPLGRRSCGPACRDG
jgi:hypothetical protein